MATKLCLRLSGATIRRLFSPPSLILSPRLPYSQPYSSQTLKMSTEIVEHIVLFKVKPETDPSKIDSMVNSLNSLSSLDQVLHLTAGPIVRTRSSPFAFTHMLHSRYGSKEDLNAYSGHPTHVGVVADYVRPIVDDIMAVDWVTADSPGPIGSGSAMRVTFLKLKEGLGDSERSEVLEVIGGVKDRFPSIDEISFGANFSPARAKGFSVCSIAVFPGLSELEALNSELVDLQSDKVKEMIEGVMIMDYVIR